jgi:prepilin-type processing-associated H-X9-DG protein
MEERLLASLGKLQAAPIHFEVVDDVPKGGVLCALPALLALGLLRHSQKNFSLPAGYYPLETIFLSVAFLALGRVPSFEALRYEPPGEWGKLLGLDRIPEVRTLREKIQRLCADGTAVRQWSGTLAQEWMEAQPESAGILYVDGHVRVYHGHQTELPRRYVARQRLCLRGRTDYWVNAMDGQPFFVVTQAVDPGLLQVLEEQILPRLLAEVPGQPTPQALAAHRSLARLTIIFDRAGYSPEFFKEQWKERIAITTYHKFPQGQWADEEFSLHKVRLVNGEEVELMLAERGVCLSNDFWLREIRQRDEKGHQVPMLTTDFRSEMGKIAMTLFARWSQENFFQYMGQHYGLDRLIEYGTEPLPETTVVVNPAWRKKDQEVRRERAVLVRQQAQFGAFSLPAQAQPEEIAAFEQQKGQSLALLQEQQKKLEALKSQRKAAPRHVTLKDLPEPERFSQLRTAQKHFVDTIHLIAYRAETALVALAREKLARSDDARALVRQVFESSVDLCPNLQLQTLTVRLHRLSSGIHDVALEHLCAELTATETIYPGTELRLVFEPVRANPIPRDQES